MAKNTQPIVKRAKALGVTPASLGYTGKSKVDTIRNPKAQVRKKQGYDTARAACKSAQSVLIKIPHGSGDSLRREQVPASTMRKQLSKG